MSLQDRISRTSNSLLMLWKRMLSYRNSEWGFSDYPIVVRKQKDVPDNRGYSARILGWLLHETATTPDDALRKLEELYAFRKDKLIKEGKPPPRPGTDVPLQFASQERVSANEDLRDDFIHRVLEFEWAFLSDESSLLHFSVNENTDELLTRIRNVYGVDVSDITDGNIADILDRIAAQRAGR